MSRPSSPLVCALLATLFVTHTSLAGLASAAQQTPSQAAPPPRVQSVRTFGGSTRFVAPVRTVEALRRSMSRPAIRQDIARVLQGAGMSALEGEMVRILTEGQVMQTTLPSGTAIEWMALRRRGRPGIIRNARWDGRPAPGYQFVIDNLSETYTFFVPEVCGNISLIAREPSREAARRAEETRVAAENARRAEEARADEARKAEEARAAEAAAAESARKAEEARRADDARKAEEARQAEAARQAEEARTAEEARQAEIARLEAEAQEARFRPFVNGLFGKQHRQYDDTDPAKFGRLVNPVIAFGDAVIGAKGGVALRLSDRWALWPAIGLSGNLERRQRSSLFGDLEMAYRFPAGAYLGSGLTMWDMTHPDIFTIGWLGTGGVRLWRNAAGNNDLDLSAEWRQFFDRGSDPDVNYQFWAGVRFVFR